MNKELKGYKKYIYILLGIIGILLIWEISSQIVANFNVFPTIGMTLNELFILLGDNNIYISLLSSLGLTLLSLLISFIMAFILGILSGLYERLYLILKPIVAIFKTLPTACFVFILVIFFKSSISIIIVTFLLIFPIMYESITKGFIQIDERMLLSLDIDGGRKSKNAIFKVLIPQSVPYIMLGLVNSIGLGLKVEIMAEILIGNNSINGIGKILWIFAQVEFDYVKVFAVSVLILIIFAIIDLIFLFIKHKIEKTL